MSSNPVRAADARRTETPNAVMTTLASPSQGPTTGMAMWIVDMRAGQAGPLHVFDVEQVWHVLDGEVVVTVEGRPVSLGSGDTLVLPAGAKRQISAGSDVRLVASGSATAPVSVPGEAMSRGVPPWIG